MYGGVIELFEGTVKPVVPFAMKLGNEIPQIGVGLELLIEKLEL